MSVTRWAVRSGLFTAALFAGTVALAQEPENEPPPPAPATTTHAPAPNNPAPNDPQGGHGDPHVAPAGQGDPAAPAGNAPPTGHAADPHAAPTAHGDSHAAPAGHGDPHAGPAAHGDPASHGDEHAAGGHEPHGEHAGSHHGPQAINWTDFSDKSRPAFIGLVINFGILAAIYYTLGRKPVTEGLKQRRINIGKDIEDARAMLQEAKERAKKYQADLKNADADAATAKAALVSAGKGEVERLITETAERADRMTADAERLVEQERAQLQQDLLIETINVSVENAQKLLERSVTPEDHARLANELLAELGRKPAAARRAPASVRPGGAA